MYTPSATDDSDLEEEVDLPETEPSMQCHLETVNPSSHEETPARYPLSSYRFNESAMA